MSRRYSLKYQTDWKAFFDKDEWKRSLRLPPIPSEQIAVIDETPMDPGPEIIKGGRWCLMSDEEREAEGWFQVAPGRWRWSEERPSGYTGFAAAHDPNYFKNGRFQYQTHGRKDTGDQPCIEDMQDKRARTEWPNYVVTTDGKGRRIEGPAPFRSSDEKRAYEREFGLRQIGRCDGTGDNRDTLKSMKDRNRSIQEARIRELQRRTGDYSP